MLPSLAATSLPNQQASLAAAHDAELWRRSGVLFTQVVTALSQAGQSEIYMWSVEVKAPEAEHGLAARARVWIESLGPYQSLLLLAIPVCLVEPMKFAAVAIAGDGHWITGTAMIIAAYAASLLLVERLFLVVKPKLLMLPWFASIWTWFVTQRAKVLRAVGWPGEH